MRSIAALLLFLSLILSQSCAIPRCKGRYCAVRMVHYHQGYEYRGVSLYQWHFKYKNPRYGEGSPALVKDPGAVPDGDNNGFRTKVKASRRFIKPKAVAPKSESETSQIKNTDQSADKTESETK